MRRREFIAALGGRRRGRWWRAGRSHWDRRAAGCPQTGAPPDPLVEAMQGRLREFGYLDGRDIAFEFRWAEGKREQVPRSTGTLNCSIAS